MSSEPSPHDPRQLDARGLREQTRALRSLARSLVDDEHTAEDVTQDAMVTAMRTPPKAGWSLGAWLRGITRNHARDERRSATRRRRREEVAAQSESYRESDGLERVDLLQHLLQHVRQLDEPYRSTVLLHYFDGLSQREVAKRQGVAFATVRTRLHRAVETLRARMDADAGGDRRAWMLPLLPFVHAPNPGPFTGLTDGLARAGEAAGSLGSKTLATLTMKKQAIGIGALALVAAGSGIWFWQTSRDLDSPRDDLSATLTADETIDDEASEDLALGDNAGTEDRRAGESKTPTTKTGKPDLAYVVVRGFVRDRDARALADARVVGFKGEATTNASGAFSLRVPIGYLKSTKKGATVATFAKKRRRDLMTVRAFAKGHTVQEKVAALDESGESATVDFALGKGFAVVGRVLAPSKKPIANASIGKWDKSVPTVRSDEDGWFRLDHLDPANREHWIHARAEGFMSKWERVVLDQGPQLADVRRDFGLERGATVRGVVYTADRRVVPGASVIVRDKPELKTRTNERGEFEIAGVHPGEKRLVVRHEEFPPKIEDVTLTLGQALELQVVLEAGASFAGRVEDPAGNPIAGASVHAWSDKAILTKITTSDDGSFDLRGLPPASFDVMVAAAGYVSHVLEDQTAPRRGARVVLDRGARLAGHVVDAVTNRPVPEFRVRFVTSLGGKRGKKKMGKAKKPEASNSNDRRLAMDARDFVFGGGRQFTNDDGTWDTGESALPEGTIATIEIRAKGYAALTREGVRARIDMRHEDLRLALTPGTTLRGRVFAAETSAGIPNARVRILPIATDESTPSENRKELGVVATATTDATGAFEAVGVGAGKVRVVVRSREWGTSIHELQIPAGVREFEATLRVGAGSTLRGIVRDASDRPQGDVRVTLAAARVPGIRGQRWQTTTDASGRFEFRRLPKGTYRLARLKDFGSGAKSLPTLPRFVQIEKTVHEVELSPRGLGTVRGRITCASNAVPSGVYLRIISEEKGSGPNWTFARDGVFTIEGLAPGRYRIECNHETREGRALSGSGVVEITKAGEQRFELKLR